MCLVGLAMIVLSACEADSVDELVATSSTLTLEDVQAEIDEFESRMEEMADCPAAAGDILTVEMVEEGCMEGDEWVFPGVWDCADGRQLWSEGKLWGWVGEPIVEADGDAAADPGYAAAYDDCSP